MAIVTNAGGPGVIATDALIAELDSCLPTYWSHGNPVDILGDATDRFTDTLRPVLADDQTDAVLVVLTPQAMTDPTAIAKAVVTVANESRKPVLAAWMGGAMVEEGVRILHAAGVATYPSPEHAVRAFMHLVAYGRNRELLYETPQEVPIDLPFVSRKSFDTASFAVGAVIEAVDAVMEGPGQQAVCLVRPPGHHALPTMAMGFCLFNNIAIGAIHARRYHCLNRILIVDWDVHHGNSTQHNFYRDHDVYYVSVHRSPFFPGTGAAEETGEGEGLGTTFNLPLAFGVSRQELLERFRTHLNDAASRCRPELVLLSAGFDAHHADPVGSLGLETEDYAPLTKMVLDIANEYCDGRMVSVLEGGYSVPVLADCVEIHLRTLLHS